MGIINCNNVTKKFGDYFALTDVTLDIPEGKIFGMLGPNGAGKTTLIRIINRITLPTSGKVLFNGNEMKLSDIESIGYLPEERGLYKKMKIGEQAIYLAQLKGMDRQKAERELKKWFVKFEIQPWWNKKVEELSKGMAQKIQFIITVLHNPKLLILDEPFSGFDPINVELIRNEILRLKNEGATIILSTHNMESVEELCDDIALINKSKLILSGEVDKIRKEYGDNKVEIIYSPIDDSPKEEKDIFGDSSELFTITSSENKKGKIHSILELKQNITNRDLLDYLINRVDLHSYQQMLPRMREIFIKLVQASGGAVSNSINDINNNNLNQNKLL